MSDFLDQIIKATSPLFNFFYEWCWLILPLAYFESCFFTANICKNIMQKKGYDDLKQWYRVGLFLNVFGSSEIIGGLTKSPYSISLNRS